MTIKTNSPLQTKKVAHLLALTITEYQLGDLQNALVFALTGDLGAGKTTFVQGFLNSWGSKKKITSPTFVIIKKFSIPQSKSRTNFKRIYHIDCYRIEKAEELLGFGLREILENPQNIVLIEWPEKIKKFLPPQSIWIEFQHGNRINERTIKIFSR